MATEQQQSALTDVFISVFGSDSAALEAALTRMKLQNELAEIESEQRNLQAEADASAQDYVAQLSDLAAERAAKVAKIDALG